jgi:TDG/mug DNA glycosylase family protein
MRYQHVTHQDIAPFYDPDSRILILGSLPSIGSRKAHFYYAYRTNRFFAVLASLFEEKEPLGTEERKAFLKRHHIALYDVIWECDIQASSDSSIRNAVPNDLSLIRKQAKIQAVFTTGKTASRLYREYDGEDNIELPSPSAANAAMSLLKLKEAYSVILPYLSSSEKGKTR